MLTEEKQRELELERQRQMKIRLEMMERQRREEERRRREQERRRQIERERLRQREMRERESEQRYTRHHRDYSVNMRYRGMPQQAMCSMPQPQRLTKSMSSLSYGSRRSYNSSSFNDTSQLNRYNSIGMNNRVAARTSDAKDFSESDQSSAASIASSDEESASASDQDSDDDDGDSKFERGDKVEARYGGKSKWYKGKVSLAHSDGTYDILYEDGDKERKVKANLIRRQ